MAEIIMPKARDYGWELKPISSAYFKVVKNKSDQLCVILAHSLLRGISTEMLFWWFQNFPNLKVKLEDVEGYEGQTVPAYLLWHPSDHVSARLSGKLGPNNTSRVGAKIHIQEFMQYQKYKERYKVDQALTIFYHDQDGWCMGKTIPIIGDLMKLRISFKDVLEAGQVIGVQYHYEIVAGSHQQNFLAKMLTQKVVGNFKEEFWTAWLTHNVIEVGVFENFLPVLYAQRNNPGSLQYAKDMNPMREGVSELVGYNKALFEERVAGYLASTNGFAFQNGTEKNIL